METRSSRGTRLSLPSDREILIVRDFNAPKSLVFDAWSVPEYVRRWQGCRQQTMLACEIDFREGGAWRWVLRDLTSGVDHVFSGEYRLIARPDRLEFVERYEAVPGSDHTVTLTFEEQDRVTTMSMRILHRSAQNRDGHLASGMERGLEDMFDRIEELTASMEVRA